jgi:hypothetical protein
MPCVRALVRWMMVLPLKSTAVTEIPIPSSGGVRESLATLSPRRIIVPENSGFFVGCTQFDCTHCRISGGRDVAAQVVDDPGLDRPVVPFGRFRSSNPSTGTNQRRLHRHGSRRARKAFRAAIRCGSCHQARRWHIHSASSCVWPSQSV